MAAALGLTREQKEAIRDLEGPGHGPPGGRPGDHPPPGERRPGGPPPKGPGHGPPGPPPRKRSAADVSDALALLTPEQQARWRRMAGEPFAGGPTRPDRGPGRPPRKDGPPPRGGE